MLYLDHAATSRPKAPGVAAAVARWFDEVGVSPDRGDSALCQEAAQVADSLRRRLARRCGTRAERIAITSGATESINLFLRGFLAPGDRVLTTALEHSSVVRPLHALSEERGIELTVVPLEQDRHLAPERLIAALAAASPRLLVFTHASNVTGQILPAREIVAAARAHGVTTLIDASQTAGVLPMDVGADAVAFSAHKSLLGPPGLGVLAAAGDLELRSVKQGGTGSSQALDRQPETWPQVLESGTPNTPAWFGLAAALDWLDRQHEPGLLQAGQERLAALESELETIPGVVLLRPADEPRLPILSLLHRDYDPAELGMILGERGIHVRSGAHCAPWIHDGLGSAASGGTLRISPGPFVSAEELLRVPSILDGA